MQKRRTISVGPSLNRLLGRGSAGALPVSTKLDVVAERYMELLAAALPQYDTAEWASLFVSVGAAGRGQPFWSRQPAQTLKPLLVHAVEAQVERETKGRDVDRSTSKIRFRIPNLDTTGVVAAIDLAERYWVEHDTMIEEKELHEWLERNR